MLGKMQKIRTGELENSSIYSTSSCNSSSPSWWNLNGPHVLHPFLSKKPIFDSDQQKVNVLGFGLQHQDSSPSQSTGTSHQEVAMVPSPSGSDDTDGRRVDGHLKSSFYLRTSEKVLPEQKIDYGQSARYARFPFEDPYLGMMATYGSHLIVHHQVTSTGHAARVPLPLDIFGNKPIYVNAKQYQAILRRRQTRAKLEA